MELVGDRPAGWASVEPGADGAGGVVVSLVGEIDLSVTDAIRDSVTPQLADAGGVVFDLSGVEFLDSSGITLLLELAGAGRSVAVRAPSRAARSVIEATGLTSWLTDGS